MALVAKSAPPRIKIAAPISVQVIDHLDGFTELERGWNELLRASAADCPFLTWEWLHAWWRHLGDSQGLRLVTARMGDELVAIAPLWVSRSTLPWLSRLEFLGTGYAGSDYLDIIVRRGCEAEGIRTIGRSIESQGLALHLNHLPPASLSSQLPVDLAKDGWTSSETAAGVCPFIRLAGHSWDSYLATLGSAHRANFRRRLRTLSREFHLTFERVTSEPQRQAALAALMAFHDQRWGKRDGSTAFPTPELCAFHDDATERALKRGWLRLYVLQLDDRPAAVMYGFVYNRRFYFYQHGFDERYARHSVGLVLMALAVRAAIEEGALEFDMLYGTEPYKSLWTHETRGLRQLRLFPAHVGGRIHERTVKVERTMRTLARRIRSVGEGRAT